MTDRRLIELRAPTSLKCGKLACRFEFAVDEARKMHRIGGGEELLCPRCDCDKLLMIFGDRI